MKNTRNRPVVVSRDGPDIVIRAPHGYWRLMDDAPARAILAGLRQRGHAIVLHSGTHELG